MKQKEVNFKSGSRELKKKCSFHVCVEALIFGQLQPNSDAIGSLVSA